MNPSSNQGLCTIRVDQFRPWMSLFVFAFVSENLVYVSWNVRFGQKTFFVLNRVVGVVAEVVQGIGGT